MRNQDQQGRGEKRKSLLRFQHRKEPVSESEAKDAYRQLAEKLEVENGQKSAFVHYPVHWVLRKQKKIEVPIAVEILL
ncbi:MAG: hypothetical protein KA436_01965 [Oligoflexales bacterium]|nr:hypothetical protein [Oligoflexales bacterium]